jgi:hypothetical protein
VEAPVHLFRSLLLFGLFNFLFRGSLLLPHGMVSALSRNETRMGSPLYNLAFVENQDLIRSSDSGETVPACCISAYNAKGNRL